MSKKKIFGITILAVLVVAALLIVRSNRQNFTETPIESGPIIEAVYGIGTVTPSRTYEFKPAVATEIVKVFVREGDSLQKGAPLIQIESGSTIRSPIHGVVTSVRLNEGETAFPNSPVVTVTDLSQLYFNVNLEQQGALRVQSGMPATLKFAGVENLALTGKVTSIYSSSGSFLVRIDVSEIPSSLLPGMTADVAIILNRKEGVLLAPVAALVGKNLLILRNGKRFELPVKVGLIDGEKFEIISDEIKPEDIVLMRQN